MQKNIKAYNQDSSNNEFAALLQEDLDKRVTKESSLVDAIVTKIEVKLRIRCLKRLGYRLLCFVAFSRLISFLITLSISTKAAFVL